MNKRDLFTLVLGSTGKTGSRVVADLINRGLKIRTAARSGAHFTFGWHQRDSYAPALDGIARVYLVAPVMRIAFADDVSAFLDAAEAAGGPARDVPQRLRHGTRAGQGRDPTRR